MLTEEPKGLKIQDFPWMTKICVNGLLDAVGEDKNSLKEMGIPTIDAHIRWDGILLWTYTDKKVESIADYLMGRNVNPLSPEYEIAYLRNREPLRVRVAKFSMKDMVIKAEGEEHEKRTVP